MRKVLTVVDLFSGSGGMSTGFAKHDGFRLVGAVDIEQGKPSGGPGVTSCNKTYGSNLGVVPVAEDMSVLEPCALRTEIKRRSGMDLAPGSLGVLSACPPCTDFSRAKPTNHLVDGGRNDLVRRVGDFAAYFRPRHIVIENARELLRGHYRHHADLLMERLRADGYSVASGIEVLSRFGVPQIRERALIVASRIGEAQTLDDLWEGYALRPGAATVRTALSRVAAWQAGNHDDPMDVGPGMRPEVRHRVSLIPRNGGSWSDIAAKHPDALTPSMLKRWEKRDLGSHPDVYGRMWWDRPAPTIKRECAHVGNGRYVHPEETRLLTVREMASLQGFPFDYRFVGPLANRYRQIGDAVPPVIGYQLASVVSWMETGVRPAPADFVLPRSVMEAGDILLQGGESLAA